MFEFEEGRVNFFNDRTNQGEILGSKYPVSFRKNYFSTVVLRHGELAFQYEKWDSSKDYHRPRQGETLIYKQTPKGNIFALYWTFPSILARAQAELEKLTSSVT